MTIGVVHHTDRFKKGAHRMLKKYWLDLQFFAEGAEGGDGADGGSAEGIAETSGEDVLPAHIPERAKRLYKNAVEANKPKAEPKVEQPTEEVQETTTQPTHIPFTDLIKSDEYKEEHKAYMDKTISDRLKKYKGIEESNGKMSEALSKVAVKYGLDANSDDFLDSLTKAIDEDDSYVESYALEHDLSTEEAKKSLEMQRKLEAYEAERKAREQQAAQQEQINRLLQNAERTKAMYPEFDLDIEMQNEKFRNMCAVTQGDTTVAYQAIHHDELMQRQGLQTAQIATQQIANSVAANKSRPIENGLSSQASATISQSFNGMSLREIRAAADMFRKNPERLK